MQKKEKVIRGKGRRGAAHIEVILSFVLFISFLIFVFAFINPVKRTEPSRALLDIAGQEIIKNSSVNITTASFKLDYTPAAPCFNINLLEVGVNEIIGDNNVIIRDSEDNAIKSRKINADLGIETSGDCYKIFASEDFNAVSYSPASCEDIEVDNIAIGQVTTRKAISFERIIKFNSTYSQDYKTLKQSINFPAGNDFGFVLKDNSRNVILDALKEKPESAIVIAKEQPIELVYENSSSIVAVINIQAW